MCRFSLLFIFYFIFFTLKCKEQEAEHVSYCPQDTKDTPPGGWSCLLLFGVKSLHLFVVKSSLFHHSKIVPLVYAAQVHLHLSDTSRTILIVKLGKICQ